MTVQEQYTHTHSTYSTPAVHAHAQNTNSTVKLLLYCYSSVLFAVLVQYGTEYTHSTATVRHSTATVHVHGEYTQYTFI
eukprot:scaffold2957_cov226-Isochrysis_galbana.AAC.8